MIPRRAIVGDKRTLAVADFEWNHVPEPQKKRWQPGLDMHTLKDHQTRAGLHFLGLADPSGLGSPWGHDHGLRAVVAVQKAGLGIV